MEDRVVMGAGHHARLVLAAPGMLTSDEGKTYLAQNVLDLEDEVRRLRSQRNQALRRLARDNIAAAEELERSWSS